jgi:metal-responsive CopG/Arc/MetJ family transcriptional regulator
MNERMNKVLIIRINESLLNEIDQYLRAKRMKKSRFVRNALEAALKRAKENNGEETS